MPLDQTDDVPLGIGEQRDLRALRHRFGWLDGAAPQLLDVPQHRSGIIDLDVERDVVVGAFGRSQPDMYAVGAVAVTYRVDGKYVVRVTDGVYRPLVERRVIEAVQLRYILSPDLAMPDQICH